MSLIDVDELREELIGVRLEGTSVAYGRGFYDGLRKARSLLNNAPTVNHVPQGEWVYVGKCHIQEWHAINNCSVCGHSVYNVSYGDKVVHFNHCPHCGAKMEGDSK